MLKIMTYNLKYANDAPPHAWTDRRPLVANVIRKASPDLLGTQEGLYRQLRELATDLPEYDWIGTGRDGGSRGEFMAIFFRRDRFEPIAFDHFWLSDTPDTVGSATWGNSNRRMVTWVRLREREGGAQVVHANTHFDFADDWHVRAADVLIDRLNAIDDASLVLTGDFNAAAGASPAHTHLVTQGPFTDTWDVASERRGEGIGSFHDWQGPSAGPRIDWVLTRGPARVHGVELIATGERDGLWPSDHFPILAEMTLG